MKNLSIIKVTSLLLVALLAFGGLAVSAEETTEPKPATVEFTATENEDGIVELALAVKDTTFMGIQAAVRYDKDVLIPANESGEPAAEFKDFAAKAEEAELFNTVGLNLDTEKGLFGLTLYLMPGTEGENINDSAEYVAGDEGVQLYKFNFKKLSDTDYSFEIALKDDIKPYQISVPEGLIIMDYANGSLESTVTFIYDNKDSVQTTIAAIKAPIRMDSMVRKQDVICLQIGKNLSIAHGQKKAIDEENKLVVPYISNERTLVPLRFVAETLGAEVVWENDWDYCIIKKGEKEIKITFGSAVFEVNGEEITYDAPIEVVQERTMVPIRFISEQLECDVYWNAENSAVVISPIDNPWVEERQAEKIALGEMLVTILSII